MGNEVELQKSICMNLASMSALDDCQITSSETDDGQQYVSISRQGEPVVTIEITDSDLHVYEGLGHPVTSGIAKRIERLSHETVSKAGLRCLVG